MKRSPAILTIALALIFGLVSLSYWLPQTIEEQALIVLKLNSDNNLSQQKVTDARELSPELLQYIQEERQAANSVTDVPDYDEMLRRYEEFERDQAQPLAAADTGDADGFGDPLASRFAKFDSQERDEILKPEFFATPQGLKNAVSFWTHVFGVFGRNHVVFYNQDDVGIVYSVLDFTDLAQMNPDSSDAIQNQMIRQESQRLNALIAKIAPLAANPEADPAALHPEERRLFDLLRANADHVNISPDALKQSFAYRNGFAHRMKQAIALSGQYMPEMRRIFEERGLPPELTVIPFVESSFNLNAYSSAGAAGIWQFIQATGKSYLRIDDVVDERYDPILATYAAAAHLSKEYKLFRNWALTINGYNTGPGRILQAVKQLQTDSIEHIVKFFKGSGYGFDSRNYYPEFLAALEVYRNRDRYFGEVEEFPVQPYEYVRAPSDLNLRDLIRMAGLDESLMRELNLAIKPDVLSGTRKLPKGYLLKIPPADKDNILLAMDELRRDSLMASYHVMEKGESLNEVARRYGFEVEAILDVNEFFPGDKIGPGTIVKLPGPREDSSISAVMPGDEGAIAPLR